MLDLVRNQEGRFSCVMDQIISEESKVEYNSILNILERISTDKKRRFSKSLKLSCQFLKQVIYAYF